MQQEWDQCQKVERNALRKVIVPGVGTVEHGNVVCNVDAVEIERRKDAVAVIPAVQAEAKPDAAKTVWIRMGGLSTAMDRKRASMPSQRE